MSKENEIAQLLAPIANAHELYVEEIVYHRAGKHSTLRVTVDLPDGPGGVDADVLTAVTRAMSEELDEADPIAGQYNLEVSTPGVDRPLTEPRHFSRAYGRLVTLTLTDGTELEGRLGDLDGDTVLVAVGGDERQIALEDVASAKVKLEF